MNDLEKWLEQTAELRKRLCAAEKRSARNAARKEAEAAARREAFWRKHPDLRPRAEQSTEEPFSFELSDYTDEG